MGFNTEKEKTNSGGQEKQGLMLSGVLRMKTHGTSKKGKAYRKYVITTDNGEKFDTHTVLAFNGSPEPGNVGDFVQIPVGIPSDGVLFG